MVCSDTCQRAIRRERARFRRHAEGREEIFLQALLTCRSKRDYNSWAVAAESAGVVLAKASLDLVPYKCPFCPSWHLTKRGTKLPYRRNLVSRQSPRNSGETA